MPLDFANDNTYITMQANDGLYEGIRAETVQEAIANVSYVFGEKSDVLSQQWLSNRRRQPYHGQT